MLNEVTSIGAANLIATVSASGDVRGLQRFTLSLDYNFQWLRRTPLQILQENGSLYLENVSVIKREE